MRVFYLKTQSIQVFNYTEYGIKDTSYAKGKKTVKAATSGHSGL